MKRAQINKTRNEKEVTVYPTEIQTTIKDYFKANKRKTLDEMDKFFERYNLPRLSQEEIENMNRPVSSTFNTVIESVVLKLPTKVQEQMTS